MHKSWTLAVVAAVAVGVAAQAQNVKVNSRTLGKQRITEFAPVSPPDIANVPPGELKNAEMTAKNWICGKQFTDADGTIWRLRAGSAESAKPDKVIGWMAYGKDNSRVFVSVNGGVFVPYVVPAGNPPLKKLVDALNPKDQR
jgi:hypothetical protein